MQVTEFQQHTKVCSECKSIHKANFPTNLNATVQYGDNIKSLISYGNTYQMIPYERISEMVEDFTSHKISKGTIFSMLQNCYNKLEDYENDIKKLLLNENVIHCDETGVSVAGKLHYTHVISLTNFAVPFTNNLTERDLRMIKVKEKISGTFASFRGGEIFNRIRGYISTVKKNNRSMLAELNNIFVGRAFVPLG